MISRSSSRGISCSSRGPVATGVLSGKAHLRPTPRRLAGLGVLIPLDLPAEQPPSSERNRSPSSRRRASVLQKATDQRGQRSLVLRIGHPSGKRLEPDPLLPRQIKNVPVPLEPRQECITVSSRSEPQHLPAKLGVEPQLDGHPSAVVGLPDSATLRADDPLCHHAHQRLPVAAADAGAAHPCHRPRATLVAPHVVLEGVHLGSRSRHRTDDGARISLPIPPSRHQQARECAFPSEPHGRTSPRRPEVDRQHPAETRQSCVEGSGAGNGGQVAGISPRLLESRSWDD